MSKESKLSDTIYKNGSGLRFTVKVLGHGVGIKKIPQ
jgi:hypothetical protein